MRNRKTKEERLAETMSVEANESAVAETILKKLDEPVEIEKKTKATSFRFPVSFIDKLDAFQRSNELNPARVSKTGIVMAAVTEYIERHQNA